MSKDCIWQFWDIFNGDILKGYGLDPWPTIKETVSINNGHILSIDNNR